jgi:hypothetical protein
VHTLLKGLEKIAASADIPMIVAGDFNSLPGSAAHDLLTHQSVRPDHKVRCKLVDGRGGGRTKGGGVCNQCFLNHPWDGVIIYKTLNPKLRGTLRS